MDNVKDIDLEQMGHLRNVSQKIAQFLNSRLSAYLATITPLFAPRKILGEFSDWMGRQGHATLDEFRGAVCPKIKGNDDIERAQDCVADIDPETCVNCGVCGRVCIYGAALPGEDKHCVDEETCEGCGLCVELCPVKAIDMIDLAEPRTFELGVK